MSWSYVNSVFVARHFGLKQKPMIIQDYTTGRYGTDIVEICLYIDLSDFLHVSLGL